MKYQVYVLELCGHRHDRCLGMFDSKEKAQAVLDRAQCYRTHTNRLVLSVIDVLEQTDDDINCVANRIT
jgi:hypothetical protein